MNIVAARNDLPRTSLEALFRETSREQPLTLEEELALAGRIQEGDLEALHELVVANVQFVISIAKKYTESGIPLEDIVAEGILGLVKAARRYDPGYRVKFITYAVWWVRCSILDSLYRHGGVARLPISRIRVLRVLQKNHRVLEQHFGREVSKRELAEYSDTGVEEIDLITAALAAPSSLDSPVVGDGDVPLTDILAGESSPSGEIGVGDHERRKFVAGAFSRLNARQKDILSLYYGLDGNKRHTLEEIGGKYGVSRERIRQLRDQALERLRFALSPVDLEMPA
jgi:RNA polymerase primary sigma factor